MKIVKTKTWEDLTKKVELKDDEISTLKLKVKSLEGKLKWTANNDSKLKKGDKAFQNGELIGTVEDINVKFSLLKHLFNIGVNVFRTLLNTDALLSAKYNSFYKYEYTIKKVGKPHNTMTVNECNVFKTKKQSL